MCIWKFGKISISLKYHIIRIWHIEHPTIKGTASGWLKGVPRWRQIYTKYVGTPLHHPQSPTINFTKVDWHHLGLIIASPPWHSHHHPHLHLSKHTHIHFDQAFLTYYRSAAQPLFKLFRFGAVLTIYYFHFLLGFSLQNTEQNQAMLLHEVHWPRMQVPISSKFSIFHCISLHLWQKVPFKLLRVIFWGRVGKSRLLDSD